MKSWIPLLLFIPFLLCGCQENFETRLKRETKEYTLKHCPSQMDSETTFDSITYDIGSRSLTRWYTFSGYLDTPTAHVTACQHLNELKSQLLVELRGDTSWNNCKDEKVNFCYIYTSAASRKTIFKITLTPDDYQR